MIQARASRCDFPLSARLYLPEIWAEDPERRQSVHVPETVTFASKPALARPLLDRAQAWGVPFATVVTDVGYGILSFLRALDERHLPYICAVASDFGVRLLSEMEQAAVPPAEPAKRKRGQPKKPRPAPRHDVKEVTEALPEDAWQTVVWREGSRGALRKQFVALRVHAESAVLAIVKATAAAGPDQKAGCLGNAPSQERKANPSGFSVACPYRRP